MWKRKKKTARSIRTLFGIALLGASFCAFGAWADVPQYQIIDLGVLPGSGITSRAHAISDPGVIVGWSDYGFLGPKHAFLWRTTGEGMVDLSGAGGPVSIAHDVNNASTIARIAGEVDTAPYTQARVWVADLTTSPPPISHHGFAFPGQGGSPPSAAYALNDDLPALVVGAFESDVDSCWKGFYDTSPAGKAVKVLVPVGSFIESWGFGINDGNGPGGIQVWMVGESMYDDSEQCINPGAQPACGPDLGRAANWGSSGASGILLDRLDAEGDAAAVDVNDYGLIVGWERSYYSQHPIYCYVQAMMWASAGGVLYSGAEKTVAKAVNNLDYVVGWENSGSPRHSVDPNNAVCALLWEPGPGGWTEHDLNDHHSTNWNVLGACGINSNGVIVGWGRQDHVHALMLRPIPDCPGDFDGSGEVDVLDLLALVMLMNTDCDYCADCPADLDADCETDDQDLQLLIYEYWGPCP